MDEFTGPRPRDDGDADAAGGRGAGPGGSDPGRAHGTGSGATGPGDLAGSAGSAGSDGAGPSGSAGSGGSGGTGSGEAAGLAGSDGAGSSGSSDSPGSGGSGRGRWDLGWRATGPVVGLAASLVEALGALAGPEGLDDGSLAEAVTGLVRVRSVLDAVTSGFVGRWDARCLWADDGSKGAGARLGRDVGCRRESAGRLVRTSRATRSMPLVSEAWREGRISTDHVERLVRAATPERAEAFTKAEAHLVHVAATCDWSVFEHAVGMFASATDDELCDPSNPDDLAKRAKRERAHRNMRPVQVGDRWYLPGSLDKTGGQTFADVWERIRNELWEADMAAARESCGPDASTAEVTAAAAEIRTHAQRGADALVEMATRAAATPADGQRPRPLISVVVSHDELVGPIREIVNGLVLSRLEVAQLLFEADFERIIYGPTGQPVDVASPHRFFTGGWRRAVEVRDRVCQHPTCDVTAEYCHVDHIIEHIDGGETTVENGRLLCPRHNHQRPGRQPPPASRRDTPGRRSGSGDSSTPNGDDDGDPEQP